MADIPKFLAGLNTKAVTIATGNPDRTGNTGSSTAIVQGGANGTIVHRVKINAVGNTTAGSIRFFLVTTEGTFLVHEEAVTAVDVTSNPTGQAFSKDLTDFDVSLKAGETLKAATHNTEAFHIVAFGEDF